ncbi:hypothetical protein CROQUDRAFT_669909 [Cronartium quercuum f. sp. fusiforme G11]|uniref:Extracellular mutant protein 11 C-terminal domain-containing protein n=1 Tax=Cronartium quercuum f. sp. fusiforme G11 TaxID=708437 RepID=A0A9P6NLU4_9BASI|nr:hypothetical protein CROQUDRAFT_669909 [Cronartium quercuum f. sp. fusiforme G11]
MTESPTPTHSKSYKKRSADRHETLEMEADRADMFPPPLPSSNTQTHNDFINTSNRSTFPHAIRPRPFSAQPLTNSHQPVSHSPVKQTQYRDGSAFSSIPPPTPGRSRSFLISTNQPVNRPMTPTPAFRGVQSFGTDSNESLVSDFTYDRKSHKPKAGRAAIPPSPAKLERKVSQAAPMSKIFTNEERKKRKLEERHLTQTSPVEIENHLAVEMNRAQAHRTSVPQIDPNSMMTKTQANQPRASVDDRDFTPATGPQNFSWTRRANHGESSSSNRDANSRSAPPEDTGESVRFMFSDEDPPASEDNCDWSDRETEVHFHEERQEAEPNLDKYPNLTAGLQTANSMLIPDSLYGQLPFEEWTKVGSLLVDRFSKQVHQAQEIGRRRIQEMKVLNEKIDERFRVLEIRRKELNQRKQNLLRGVKETISASQSYSKT